MSCILLLNCGSSSIKYQLIDPAEGNPRAVGLIERIGQESSNIEHTAADQSFTNSRPIADHTQAVQAAVEMFKAHGPSLDEVIAVGHRTVHGGQTFVQPTRIDEQVLAKMRELIPLAPLHNPPAIAGIEAAMQVFPEVAQVAIFDTAFFSALPAEAYTYAIDRDVAQRHGIRRYGFHGTSHQYVSRRAAEYLGQPLSELKLIIAHIGNGASISAIDGGVAVDASMGMTPLEGLVMGTRSGDVDPGLHNFLCHQGMSIDEVDTLLNKKSGLLGLCGKTDMRDVLAAVDAGDEDARLAKDIYTRRIVKYIGAYAAVLGGVHAVVFTGGVGENSIPIRQAVVQRLAGLGFHLDEQANLVRSKAPRVITTADSAVKVLVIPTNEELEMAIQTKALIEG